MRRRLSLPFRDWPRPWQGLWMAAFEPAGNALDDPGPGAGWAPDTRAQTRKGLELYFGFLQCSGVLDPTRLPSSHLTKALLSPYLDELKARVAPTTRASRMRDLHVGIHVMEPDADLTLIRQVVRRLERRARPSRDKHRNLVQPKALFEAGIARMERVETAVYAKADVKAVQYGDGLLMAIAICTLDRLRNLANIHIGRNLRLVNGRYVLRFEAHETKNKRPHQSELPPRLTPFVDAYLEVHRPQLLQSSRSDVLFISSYRKPMARQTMYCRFVAATKEELGVPINPHLVRDMAVTEIATNHPEKIGLAPALLHHASLGTTQAHYNQANQLEASRRYNAVLEAMRAEALATIRSGDLVKER